MAPPGRPEEGTEPSETPDMLAAAELRIQELTRRIGEYERWFGVLDNQMRVLERERQKLSAVVNHSDAGFFVTNGSLKIVWSNETFRSKLSAIEPGRLQGAGCHEALCRRDRTCDDCPAAAPFRSGTVAHHELRLESDAGPRHIYATSVPILSPSGAIEETLVMLQDITDLSVLRRSQEALRASEVRFRSIFLNAAAGMATLATDGSFLQVNPALCLFLGYTEQELVRLNAETVTYPADRAETLKIFEEIAAGRLQQMVTEKRYQRKDGGVVWGQVSAAWVRDADGQPAYGIALVQDITERRRAEEALRDEKGLVQLLQQAAVASNEATDQSEAIRLCLDLVCGYTGWPVGHAWLLATDGSGELEPTDLWHMDTPHRFERFRQRTQARRIAPGTGLAGRVLESGNAVWVADIARETGDRGDATSGTGVHAGFCFPILVGKEVAGALEFYAAEPVEPDHRLLDVMGHIGAQIGRVIERRRAADAIKSSEEQLRQAQKMEAIGTLAGGVAHDFNNILTGILGHAQLLRSSAGEAENVRRSAETIERAGRRAAELTQQLLGFARKGKHQNTLVDLRATIGEAIGLLGHTIDKRIQITRHFRCDRPFALGDPVQLQQVIMNLAVNARDAMPEGGELSFTLEQVRLSAADCQRHPGFAPGEFVAIGVRDTGGGIPPEIRARIFEPFFTTKEQGKGTGMGLAMVYGIVKNHGGFIDLESEMKAGTTLRVLLPLAAGSPEKEAARTEAIRTGSGRVLVVDDESIIRDIATQFLTRLGYAVETAGDGQEAVERYARPEHPIDLVILDMVMPRMGGRDCFRALKALNPRVRTILSSGYGLNDAVQEILDEGAVAFVQKPYEISQFSEAVEAAMKGHRPGA